MSNKSKPAQQPDLLILDADFGFMQNGSVRAWPAGKQITERVDIAQLLALDAPCRRYQEITDG